MPARDFRIRAAQSRRRIFDSAGRRRAGSDFSPLIDAFHPPFPASVEHYISGPWEHNEDDSIRSRLSDDNECLPRPSHGNRFGRTARRRQSNASMKGHSPELDRASDVRHCHAMGDGGNLQLSTSDPIFNLPSEVSDLILSYLSPATLDAARHTCKYWRMRLLSNTWILCSVLGGQGKGGGSLSGKTSHRDLLRKLDCDSSLPSTSEHPAAWRTRFRTRNLDFSIPPPVSTLTRSTFVAAARMGTQSGFLAFQLQNPAQSTSNRLRSALVMYRFDSADLPWYAGTIHDVEGQGGLVFTSVAEIRPNAEWVLTIEIGDTPSRYSLTAREAFSKSDSRFSLNKLESLVKVPGLLSDEIAIHTFDKPPKPPSTSDQSGKVLPLFPPNGGV